MSRILPLLAVAVVLSGCGPGTSSPPASAPYPGPPAPSVPDEDACGAAMRQGLVGQPLSALDRASVTGVLRVIPPGTGVTMDYSPTRLNVETDAQGRILRITCG